LADRSIHAVTGAFGYSGQYIARKLLDRGCAVVTLTNSPRRQSDLQGKVRASPFDFDHPDRLEATLQDVEVLYNTYWIRFNYRSFSHAEAVRNTLILFDAARRAGVRRIVHVSITNPSESSPLEYFSGKARLERALTESGLSYAILRPTVLFGHEDILINNIAWALRHFPVFAVFGDGQYRLQPIFVEDLADLAVRYGRSRDNVIINAIGPETFTYIELVRTIGRLIGVERRVMPAPPGVAYRVGRVIGRLFGDVVITREEIEGLMSNLLCVDTEPTGTTRLTEWIREHADLLGKRYASELSRRTDRVSGYLSQ
jgi:uncharacterized protein YbjT (DUF2867 family)